MEQSEGFPTLLFSVLGEQLAQINPEDAVSLKQAAAIYLKNTVTKYYYNDLKNQRVYPHQEGFFPSDKANLRSNILIGIVHFANDKALNKIILEIFNKIIFCDFPAKWPELPTKIIELLQDYNNTTNILAGLKMLTEIAKVYELTLDEKRTPLHAIVLQFDQIVRNLMENLTNSYLTPMYYQNNQAFSEDCLMGGTIMYHCCKFFRKVISLDIPQAIMSSNTGNPNNSLPSWFKYFETILLRPLFELENFSLYQQDNSNNSNSNNSNIDKNPYWKLKKQVASILSHFIERYGNPRKCRNDIRFFCYSFLTHYAEKFAKLFMIHIKEKKIKYMTEDYTVFALKYISEAIRHPESRLEILENITNPLDSSLFNFINNDVVYLLKLDKNDLKAYQENPCDYLRNQKHAEGYQQIRKKSAKLIVSACSVFINPICFNNNNEIDTHHFRTQAKVKKDVLLNPVMKIIYDLFEVKDDLQLKESMIYLLYELFDVVVQNGHVLKYMEQMLLNNVLTEFGNTVPIIRQMALKCYEVYYKLNFVLPNHLTSVLTGIYDNIVHNDVCVRIQAGITLGMYIQKTEARPSVQNIVCKSVEMLLSMLKDYQHEDLVLTLQEFVKYYREQVAPYAVKVVDSLFCKWSETYKPVFDENDPDMAENIASSESCLDTIYEMVETVKLDQQILIQIKPYLINIFNVVYSMNDGVNVPENLEATADLLHLLITNLPGQYDLYNYLWWYEYALIGYQFNDPNTQRQLNKGGFFLESYDSFVSLLRDFAKYDPKYFLTCDNSNIAMANTRRTAFDLGIDAMVILDEYNYNIGNPVDTIQLLRAVMRMIDSTKTLLGQDHFTKVIMMAIKVLSRGVNQDVEDRQQNSDSLVKIAFLQLICACIYSNPILLFNGATLYTFTDPKTNMSTTGCEYFINVLFHVLSEENISTVGANYNPGQMDKCSLKNGEKARILYAFSSILLCYDSSNSHNNIPKVVNDRLSEIYLSCCRLAWDLIETKTKVEDNEALEDPEKEGGRMSNTDDKANEELIDTLIDHDLSSDSTSDSSEDFDEYDIEDDEQDELNEQDEVLYFQGAVQQLINCQPNVYSYLTSTIDQNILNSLGNQFNKYNNYLAELKRLELQEQQQQQQQQQQQLNNNINNVNY